MKKILSTLLLALFSTLLSALDVSVKITPSGILAGEFASLSITCDREGDMKFDLPEVKGIKWFRNRVSTSRSYSSVNGVTSIKITRSIHFTATEPGSYEIPPFRVTCGRESAETKSIRFSVSAPGSSPGKADNVPASAEVVWPDTGKFYTGQWIPLEVILTVPDGMAVGNYTFPRLMGTENLIFYNYTPNHQTKRIFGDVTQRRTVYKGVNATQVVFPARVRAITGKLNEIKGEITIGIVRRDENRPRGYDSFFDSYFDRMSERIVPLAIAITPAQKQPEIAPMPPVPDGVDYLEIFTPVEFSSRLSAASIAQGEALDLILNIAGADTSQLKAPELKLPGFRVYPAELRRSMTGAELRYCIIPVKSGRLDIACSFAAFDPEQGKYQIFKVTKQLEVTPSNKEKSPAVTPEIPPQSVEKEEVVQPVKTPSLRSEPLYIKTGKRSVVHLALWKNSLWFYVVGLLIMPLAAAIIFICRNCRAVHPEDLEKQAAVKAASVVLKGRKAGESLSDSERRLINSGVGAALGLSAGASASEIADKLTDSELAGWFRNMDAASFAAASQAADAVMDDKVRRKLLKILKSFVIIIALLPVTLPAQSADSLFDQGKYSEAAAIYRAEIRPDVVSPELLYNFGTASLRAGNLPAARAALLCAHKLAPRDAEITENLNLVNRKLLQNEVNKSGTPRELAAFIRDRLRPDEHLAFASLLFGLGCIIYALNLKKRAALCAVAGALAAFFILCAVSQKYDSYDESLAVTLPEYLQLMALPTDGKNSVIATLPGGSDARILQTRGDWVELEINGKTGWAKSDAVAAVIRRP